MKLIADIEGLKNAIDVATIDITPHGIISKPPLKREEILEIVNKFIVEVDLIRCDDNHTTAV